MVWEEWGEGGGCVKARKPEFSMLWLRSFRSQLVISFHYQILECYPGPDARVILITICVFSVFTLIISSVVFSTSFFLLFLLSLFLKLIIIITISIIFVTIFINVIDWKRGKIP